MKTCTTKGLNIKRTCVFSYSLWWARSAYFMAVDFISMHTFLLISAKPSLYFNYVVFFLSTFNLLLLLLSIISSGPHLCAVFPPKVKSKNKNTTRVFLHIKASRWPMVPARTLKKWNTIKRTNATGLLCEVQDECETVRHFCDVFDLIVQSCAWTVDPCSVSEHLRQRLCS